MGRPLALTLHNSYVELIFRSQATTTTARNITIRALESLQDLPTWVVGNLAWAMIAFIPYRWGSRHWVKMIMMINMKLEKTRMWHGRWERLTFTLYWKWKRYVDEGGLEIRCHGYTTIILGLIVMAWFSHFAAQMPWNIKTVLVLRCTCSPSTCLTCTWTRRWASPRSTRRSGEKISSGNKV